MSKSKKKDNSSEEISCLCQGWGWSNINEVWEECPNHYCGQLHPETCELLLDDPNRLAEEDRKSKISFQINKVKEKILSLKSEINLEIITLSKLEADLMVKTPTTKMSVLKINELKDRNTIRIL